MQLVFFLRAAACEV